MSTSLELDELETIDVERECAACGEITIEKVAVAHPVPEQPPWARWLGLTVEGVVWGWALWSLGAWVLSGP